VILQALYDYYQRKAADPESGIAPEGFEWKEIPFVIVIDRNGKFVTLEDTREGEGKFRRARPLCVPKSQGRSGSKSYEVTNLLWDHVGYVLGHPKTDDARDVALAARQHEAWNKSINSIDPRLAPLPEVAAVRAFCASAQANVVKEHPLWLECQKVLGANITFRVDGGTEPVPSSAAVREALATIVASDDPSARPIEARCLVTGDWTTVARTHTNTPISKDSKCLVSFQRSSGYDSYGKEQGFNAPVSVAAEFRYTTALNALLRRGSPNRMQVGDATTVFWSERKTELEDHFSAFFERPPPDNPDADVTAVRALFQQVKGGSSAISAPGTRFFVLGLAPSAARISVRFWYHGPVAELAVRITQHFNDLEIAWEEKTKPRFSLFWLLVELAPRREIKNLDQVPPNLAGALVRAVLEGTPYPATLLAQAIRRIRAEREVTPMRAAILKASLNRTRRVRPDQHKEITVALDTTNNNPGYRLGRLFAVLEKIQEDAQPGINATIRDRFYGAASANPITVFPQLLKLKNHHLAKISNPAFRVMHEKRLAEIFEGLSPNMPAHLAMDEQARFAIGYYHQRHALFAKTNTDSNPTT